MYAVIRTGGKQYRIQEKDTVIVEKIEGAEGETVMIDDVLFLGGETPTFGFPTVPGAKVTATIVSQSKGKKIHGYTYIKVKNQQRHYGHRQQQTQLRIDSITA